MRHLATLAAPAAVGAALLLYATGVLGLGVSHDSVRYLSAAETYASEGVLATRLSPDGSLSPLTHFPPLLPLVLAQLGDSTAVMIERSRPLNAVLLAATILLVGYLSLRCSGGSRLAAIVSASLAAVHLDFLMVHSRVWSEPLFLVFLWSTLLLLFRYLDRPTGGRACACAFPVALAILTRYIALALVPAGVLAILVCTPGLAVANKRRHAAAFLLVSLTPFALLAARNQLVGDRATSGRFEFHPITSIEWNQGLTAVTGWFAPASSGLATKLLTLAAVLALGAWLLASGRSSDGGLAPAGRFRLAIRFFLVSYVALLLLLMTFWVDSTPLDRRLLSPCLGMLSVLVPAMLVSRSRPGSARLVLAVATIALLSFNAARSVKWALASRRDGLHYATAAWRDSVVLEDVESLPSCYAIYADNPMLVYFQTGRRAWEHIPGSLGASGGSPLGHTASTPMAVVYTEALAAQPEEVVKADLSRLAPASWRLRAQEEFARLYTSFDGPCVSGSPGNRADSPPSDPGG